MSKPDNKEDFLNYKVADALKDTVKGDLNRSVTVASLAPYYAGFPEVAANWRGYFKEKDPNIFYKIGEANRDIALATFLGMKQMEALGMAHPQAKQAMEKNPIFTTTALGLLGTADSNYINNSLATTNSEKLSKEEAAHDAGAGLIGTGASVLANKYGIELPWTLAGWIGEGLTKALEESNDPIERYFAKQRLQTVLEKAKEKQDE